MDSVAETVIGLSATEIAKAIASGSLCASEVVGAHIQRIEAVNPRLNALVVPLFDSARAQAKAADALHGVPITKDSLNRKTRDEVML